MTSTTDMTPAPAPAGPPPGAGPRRLRRSRSDRIGAGVAGGLGAYFGVDPVLFRVLFATAAFFGGAGIVAYLLIWAVVPEDGTPEAPIDTWLRGLRDRRAPFWVVAVVAGLVVWLAAFSWWAPGHVVPVVVVVVLLALALGRRSGGVEDTIEAPGADGGAPTSPQPSTAPVSLTKGQPARPVSVTSGPMWPDDVRDLYRGYRRGWYHGARAAARARRRRAQPVAVTTVVVLAATLLALALTDAVAGIPFVVYAWTALGILGAGLLVGLVLRRTPRSLILPLLLAALITLGTAGSAAGLHDGVGERTWIPTTTLSSDYRFGFGNSTLDLTSPTLDRQQTNVRVDQVAGVVRVLIPRSLPVTVVANVHAGAVLVDRQPRNDAQGGWEISRRVPPSTDAHGAPITVDVHLADGLVRVEHTP